MSVSVKNQESPAEVGDSRPVSVRALQIGFVLLVGLAVLGIVLTLWTPYVSHLVWKTVEYLAGPDMEANFVGMSFGTGRFDWSTTDGRAAGSIYFTESEPTEGTWMRQVCTSFRINPNADFDSLRDETWNALMQMTSNRDDLPGDHGKADR